MTSNRAKRGALLVAIAGLTLAAGGCGRSAEAAPPLRSKAPPAGVPQEIRIPATGEIVGPETPTPQRKQDLPQGLSVSNIDGTAQQVCELFRLDFKRAGWKVETDVRVRDGCSIVARDGQDRQITVGAVKVGAPFGTQASVKVYGPGFRR